MSTTTIRLPDDLKARLAAAAERAGTTSHNFILQAILEKTEQEEQRQRVGDATGEVQQRREDQQVDADLQVDVPANPRHRPAQLCGV